MPKISAGLLMYRIRDKKPEFFIVHPGGPFWKNKEKGAWSIPKGLVEKGENEFDAAKREFEEETGIKPEGDFWPLEPIRQKSGKIVKAWAYEGDCDPENIKSKMYEINWPKGKITRFPEIDKAGFFNIEEASELLYPAQVNLLEQVIEKIR